MNRLIVFSVVCTFSLFSQPMPERVPLSGSKHAIKGFSESGEVALSVGRMLLTFRYPSGKAGRGDLTVIYDSVSGYYMWSFVPHGSIGDSGSLLQSLETRSSTVWIGSDGMVAFWMLSQINFKKWHDRASNLDDAERASMEELQRELRTTESGGGVRHELVVGEWDREFSCPPTSPVCQYGNTKIISVSRRSGDWHLRLKNRFEVELVFDKDFKWVSTKNLT